jgi:hypothetical protein
MSGKDSVILFRIKLPCLERVKGDSSSSISLKSSWIRGNSYDRCRFFILKKLIMEEREGIRLYEVSRAKVIDSLKM